MDNNGKKYSVKYLGVVDGSMGILTRKMAMQTESGSPLLNVASTLMRVSPGMDKNKSRLLSSKFDIKNLEPNIKDYRMLKPLLDGKYYEFTQFKNASTEPQVKSNFIQNLSCQKQSNFLLNNDVSTMKIHQNIKNSKNLLTQDVDINRIFDKQKTYEIQESTSNINMDNNRKTLNSLKNIDDIYSDKGYNNNSVQSNQQGSQQFGNIIDANANSFRMNGQSILTSDFNQLSKQQIEMTERQSGYPQPQLYDQHYINKYSYPKGLKCIRKNQQMMDTDQRYNRQQSLYDVEVPQNRKGFSGWKITVDTSNISLNDRFVQNQLNQFQKRHKSMVANSPKYNSTEYDYQNMMSQIQEFQKSLQENNQQIKNQQNNIEYLNKISKLQKQSGQKITNIIGGNEMKNQNSFTGHNTNLSLAQTSNENQYLNSIHQHSTNRSYWIDKDKDRI